MILTARQAEIAELVAKGFSNKQIAESLNMAPRTVDSHITQAASRLDGNQRQRSKLALWFFRTDPEELDPTG